MSKAIYKFHLDCGRMGDLDGVFVAEEDEIDERMGREIGYGEVLGKHSDLCEKLTPETLKLLSTDPADIAVLERLGLTNVGTNPLFYPYKKLDGSWVDY